MLEINARSNLWHYLGAKNGVNIAAVAYEHVTRGVRPAALSAGTKYRWLCLSLDWRAFRTSDLGFGQWLASLFAAAKIYHLFAWDDPLPFLFQLRGSLTSLPPRVGRRVLRWLSTAS